ncbi:MAG: cobS [Gemmatimonadetes bacterium]|nr:cobS [Gemmatimonadota bacterium]
MPHDIDDLPASVTYFPIVGLAVGLTGGAAWWLATFLWSAPIAVIVSVAVTVWMTGAFHEDALADSIDGFGGGWDRAQILAIMKDSRVGSYALIGVVLVVAAKLCALTTLSGTALSLTRALVAGHVLGRWSSVVLMWKLPYVRPSDDAPRASAGGAFTNGATASRLASATILSAAIVALALGWRSAIPMIVTIIVTWLAGRYFAGRLGGITGDALGAANQVVELSVYLALASRPMWA